MNIALSELRKITNKILATPIASYGTIAIDADWYWTMMLSDAYDFTVPHPKPCIGAITDDWMELKKVLAKTHMLTALDFERLGNVIKIIGKESCKKYTRKTLLRIKMSNIQKLCNVMIIRAQAAGYNDLVVDFEQYWAIDPADVYDFDKDPHCIPRSLVTDWNELRKILTTQKASPAHYEQLGRMFKVLGEAISRDGGSKRWISWLISNNI